MQRYDAATGEWLTRVQLRDPEGPARWARWHGQPTRGGSRGESERVKEALHTLNTLTLECRTCGGLVDWGAAKTEAANRLPAYMRNKGTKFAYAAQIREAKQKMTMAETDGCAGPQCTRRCQKTRYANTQRKMARAVLDGTRVLLTWPATLADVEAWQRPEQQSKEIARRVLATHSARNV